jgi:6-phosphogluconolactonase
MTFPTLNRTDAVWFLVAGSEKSDAVTRALADDGTIDETPARGVQGRQETLWLLDEGAATDLRR